MADITHTVKQQVLELYFCSDDRRIKTISSTLNISVTSVANILDEHFEKKIFFERGNFKILHSSINEF